MLGTPWFWCIILTLFFNDPELICATPSARRWPAPLIEVLCGIFMCFLTCYFSDFEHSLRIHALLVPLTVLWYGWFLEKPRSPS